MRDKVTFSFPSRLFRIHRYSDCHGCWLLTKCNDIDNNNNSNSNNNNNNNNNNKNNNSKNNNTDSTTTTMPSNQKMEINSTRCHSMVLSNSRGVSGDSRVEDNIGETASLLGPSITNLYNLSINTSSFPSDWKTAIAKPVFKHRGRAEDPANYRPISLLPAIGKILDNIQGQALRDYLLVNELLTDCQFGFLPHRSTTTQLVSIVDEWVNARGMGKPRDNSFHGLPKSLR